MTCRSVCLVLFTILETRLIKGSAYTEVQGIVTAQADSRRLRTQAGLFPTQAGLFRCKISSCGILCVKETGTVALSLRSSFQPLI
jgi:hypothetical protein